METTKVIGERSQDELQAELFKQIEENRRACLQEIGQSLTPILQKYNMMLDIVVTLSSSGMKTALNVIPNQNQGNKT